MAYAFDPDNLDPQFRSIKNSDDAWCASLALIRQLTEQERQAEEDRTFAATLAGVTLDEIPDDLRRMAILHDDYDDEDEDDDDEIVEDGNEIEETVVPNKTVPIVRKKTTTSTPSKPKKCTACMESVKKTDPLAPCRHAYCIACLRVLFTASMQDESLMPPRCCQQEIPTALARLTPKETENFNAKRLEYSTTDRLYCSKPSCSTFIPPARIVNSVGTCPKPVCGATTCSICKAASHGILDCPKDAATAVLLDAARVAGWARCYKCRALIELAQGCYHMTCRCRAEFCYLCSIPWKNCPCAQWDEARLLQEARVRTARIPTDPALAAINRIDLNLRVEQIANQLRANHECRHTGGWVYTHGGGRCDECSHFLPQYLFRCRQCQFMACNRCRRNRL